ncbi:hypothetical protein [Streptomyces angustmyceticus]|uniref:hypothetical protein n=1 Tax=Streptomyces angustmyceticus TaxID=285578 RepID=UPI00344DB75F
MRAALNVAVARGLIVCNAAAHAELAAAKRRKALVWTAERIAGWLRTGEKPSPVMVWTPEQAGQFLDFLADTEERRYGLHHVITLRGPRRGEACGLRKTDRNRTRKTPAIATQLVLDGWEVIEHAPKTDSGGQEAVEEPQSVPVDVPQPQTRFGRGHHGTRWPHFGLTRGRKHHRVPVPQRARTKKAQVRS